ncbi:MAG: dTDP-4-dehydrorhamnose 3,5-epimerase family protein [Patescibacteria group bacterium]
MLSVEKTKLKNVLVFKHFCFEDHRGTYEVLYNEEEYSEAIKKETGWKPKWREDNIAKSSKNVLRGFHGDNRTWKFVTCLRGKFYIVVLNYDSKSEQFGQWQSFVLSEQNKIQVLIPPKYGHAYKVMSDKAMFHYKQSQIYQGMRKQFTVRRNDPRFNVWWPSDNPIMSRRDEMGEVVDE